MKLANKILIPIEKDLVLRNYEIEDSDAFFALIDEKTEWLAGRLTLSDICNQLCWSND